MNEEFCLTPDPIVWPQFTLTSGADGIARYVYSTNDPSGVGPVLGAFRAIEIEPAFDTTTNLVKLGDWGIFVPQRF